MYQFVCCSRPISNMLYLRPFTTDIRSLIPLPDPNAPPGSLAHYSSYPEFPPGAEVMAIYESTTSFYRAIVVTGPKEPGAGRVRIAAVLIWSRVLTYR